MKKHLEVLDLLAAGKISNQDPRVEEALRKAVAFCRGALPLDEAAERERIASLVTRYVDGEGEFGFPSLHNILEEACAQARAEGYASGHAVAGESILECGRLRVQLSAAQAEIERLQTRNEKIELELQEWICANDLRTKLENLRTAAERYWRSNDPLAYQDLWKAIKASR